MALAGGALRAGDLRHRLTLQSRGDSTDSFGEPVASWPTLATVWGRVEALTGRERVEADGREATVSHRIRLRYRSDLNATKRVVYDGRTFEVTAVLVDEVNSALELLATEQVDG